MDVINIAFYCARNLRNLIASSPSRQKSENGNYWKENAKSNQENTYSLYTIFDIVDSVSLAEMFL